MKDEIISKHILEIRYEPFLKIFDIRGFLVEELSKQLKLQDWEIKSNRVDIIDTDGKTKAFVSFTNCGFVSILPPTKNYFQDQAITFLKALQGLNALPIEKMTRLGVRSTFVAEFTGSFESLKDSFRQNFLAVQKSALDIFNARIVDVGFPLNFESPEGRFNTLSGPMEKKQMARFLQLDPDTLPDIGLFLDIDYFKEKFSNTTHTDLFNLIKSYAERSREKFLNMKTLIFEKRQ